MAKSQGFRPSKEQLAAIRQQETRLGDYEDGDEKGWKPGDNGRSIGPYQIMRSYYNDALKVDPNLPPYESLDGPDGIANSERVMQAYANRYVTEKRLGHQPTFEDFARCHNGGPNGYKKECTVGYFRSVKEHLANLSKPDAQLTTPSPPVDQLTTLPSSVAQLIAPPPPVDQLNTSTLPSLIDQLTTPPPPAAQLTTLPPSVAQLIAPPQPVAQLITPTPPVAQLITPPSLVEQLTTPPSLVDQLTTPPWLTDQFTTSPWPGAQFTTPSWPFL